MAELKYYVVKRPFARERVVYRRTFFGGKTKEKVIDNDFDLFFYEENDAFYEFFSGCCLGTYEDVKLTTLLHKDISYHGYIGYRGKTEGDTVFSAVIRVPGTDYLSVGFYSYDDGVEERAETTAEDFFQKVKPLLSRKDSIAEHFKTFLYAEQSKKIDKDIFEKNKKEKENEWERRSKEFLQQFVRDRS